jgi:hypothetical protein
LLITNALLAGGVGRRGCCCDLGGEAVEKACTILRELEGGLQSGREKRNLHPGWEEGKELGPNARPKNVTCDWCSFQEPFLLSLIIQGLSFTSTDPSHIFHSLWNQKVLGNVSFDEDVSDLWLFL